MAVTKIHAIKVTLIKAIRYICNPEKTMGGLLVSSHACAQIPEVATAQFLDTLSHCNGININKAYHLVQSFKPEETDAETAHALGMQLAAELLGDKYEYIVTTHIDKDHIHNHIMFCAANFLDYKKFDCHKSVPFQIRKISDRLCREHGLSVIENPSGNRGKGYKEWLADKNGTSWKSKLKQHLDSCIQTSKNFEEVLVKMQELGYEVKNGKHVSFRAPNQERFTRAKRLGVNYTEESMKIRIAKSNSVKEKLTTNRKKIILKDNKKVSLLIDTENNIKAQESAGFKHWAKINNLKEAAKTMNYLSDHGIADYNDLNNKVTDASNIFSNTAETLKNTDANLRRMASALKHAEVYHRTKITYKKFQAAKNKNEFSKNNQRDLIIYRAAVSELRSLYPDGKIPSVQSLKEQYSKQTITRTEIMKRYKQQRCVLNELKKVKMNVDAILGKQSENDNKKER